MKKLFILLAGASSLFAFEAQATPPAYVCMSMTAPSALDPTLGRSGYVGFYTSTNPDCGGVTSQYIVCSAGATNSECGSHAQYTDAGLQSLSQALQNAENTYQRIVTYPDQCVGSNNWGCTSAVTFYQGSAYSQ
ncbi:MAG TPA: hypothetical protein VHE32_01785 [Rhodanobacteraceae bacterium]|nr:hypothetical protein [Rhodanobacteraceae bacterium]